MVQMLSGHLNSGRRSQADGAGVNLDFTDDQEALRGTLRDVLDKVASIEVVRASEPTGFDATLWSTVVELGLVSMAIPEDRGGGGAGFLELAIAAEAIGRTLAPVPLIEAAVAATLLADLPSDDRFASLGAQAVSGELIPTVALHPATDGVLRFVPAGAVADVVIGLDGTDLVAVRLPARPIVAVPNLGAMPIADVPVDSGRSCRPGDRTGGPRGAPACGQPVGGADQRRAGRAHRARARDRRSSTSGAPRPSGC